MKSIKIASMMTAMLLVVGSAFAARPSQFDKFLQSSVKGGITKDQYYSFMTDLQDISDDPVGNGNLVPGIQTAKDLAIQEKMDLKVAADKLTKTMQADVRNIGQRYFKENDAEMRRKAAVVANAVNTVFFYQPKYSAKKQYNRSSSSRRPARINRNDPANS
jgi:hypothetical protein